MPRPLLDPEYLTDLESRTDECMKDMAAANVLPGVRDVVMTGIWLSDKLKANGAGEKESEQVCYAHGQRCFGSPDVWQTAQEAFARWQIGQPDKPGQLLAEQITADVFGGEMATHIDRIKQRRKELHAKYTKFIE